jgi:Endoglucanase
MNQEELKMRRGINLGNSLDCFEENGPGNETSWGNPPVTRETVKIFAGAGFDTLRVPVTWDGHFEETDPYTVDPAWMARVREVVEWGMESGMTVILNTHHEFRWLRPELGELWHVLPRFRALWLQIAEAFGDCGDRLIFQGVNEPNLQGGENCSEGSGNRNVRAAINAVNHTFVSAVRETGGRNAVRPLCVTGLAARPLPECMQGNVFFRRDEHLIYTLHCYFPGPVCFQPRGFLGHPLL